MNYVPDSDLLVRARSAIIGAEEQSDAASLPLVIRERDTEYQFRRVVLYDRLLKVTCPDQFSFDILLDKSRTSNHWRNDEESGPG